MSHKRAGPTPLGGDRSVAHLYGADGREVDDPKNAVRGEIVEYDSDGDELQRTYFGSPIGSDAGQFVPAGEQYDPPFDNWGTDFVKQGTWDVWAYRDGQLELATTVSMLLQAMGLQGAPLQIQRQQVGDLIAKPAWVPAPAELKQEVYAWLESTRQE